MPDIHTNYRVSPEDNSPSSRLDNLVNGIIDEVLKRFFVDADLNIAAPGLKSNIQLRIQQWAWCQLGGAYNDFAVLERDNKTCLGMTCSDAYHGELAYIEKAEELREKRIREEREKEKREEEERKKIVELKRQNLRARQEQDEEERAEEQEAIDPRYLNRQFTNYKAVTVLLTAFYDKNKGGPVERKTVYIPASEYILAGAVRKRLELIWKCGQNEYTLQSSIHDFAPSDTRSIAAGDVIMYPADGDFYPFFVYGNGWDGAHLRPSELDAVIDADPIDRQLAAFVGLSEGKLEFLDILKCSSNKSSNKG